MLPLSLKERVVVVTGAAGGLGREVCRVLLATGAHVIAVSRKVQSLEALRAYLGDPLNVTWTQASVLVAEDVEAVFQPPSGASIWGLVNIVGGYSGGPALHDSALSTLEKMIALNLKSTFLCTRAAIAHMLEHNSGAGRVVNISAVAADRAPAGHFAYAAAKSGILKLTESAAADYASTDITINAIQPGSICTAANAAAMPNADHNTWVTPEEIAHAVVFLLSDLASGINGSTIRLTGRS